MGIVLVEKIECIDSKPLGEDMILLLLKKDNQYTIIKSFAHDPKTYQRLINLSSRVWWYSFSHAQNLLQTLTSDLFFTDVTLV